MEKGAAMGRPRTWSVPRRALTAGVLLGLAASVGAAEPVVHRTVARHEGDPDSAFVLGHSAGAQFVPGKSNFSPVNL